MSSIFRPQSSGLKLKTLTLAAISTMLIANAGAAGLGDLTVQSYLGQPLRAEVELIATSDDSDGPLTVKVASFDAYRKANIEFSPALLSLQFATEQRGNRQIVRITSSQAMNEPFVDMLLELRGKTGAIVREYVFLLDPAIMHESQPAAVATVSTPEPAAQQPKRSAAGRAGAARTSSAPAPAVPASAAEKKSNEEVKSAPPAAASGKPRLALTSPKMAAGTADEISARAAKEYAAMEQAVADANARVKALEQKVSDLQKLLEVTNALLAEMQKQKELELQAKATGPAVDSAPAANAVPASAEAKPVPAPAPAPAAPPPATAAKPAPAPEESSWDSDLLLPGAGLLVAALGAVGIVLSRRRNKPKPIDNSLFAESIRMPETARRTIGNLDASLSSLLPSGASGEVDPVAEADVYIAYGRDVQAEELLKEALRLQPGNHAASVKLLTIYATRKDKESFEKLARELYGKTKGEGDQWSQAAAMGIGIDPGNPLYATANPVASAPAAAPLPTLQEPTPEPESPQPLIEMKLDALDDIAQAAQPDTSSADALNELLDAPLPEPMPAEQIAPPAPEQVTEELDVDVALKQLDEPVFQPTHAAVEDEPKLDIGPLDFDFLKPADAEKPAEVPTIPSDAIEEPKESSNLIEFDFLKPAAPEAEKDEELAEIPLIPLAEPVEVTDLASLDFLDQEIQKQKK